MVSLLRLHLASSFVSGIRNLFTFLTIVFLLSSQVFAKALAQRPDYKKATVSIKKANSKKSKQIEVEIADTPAKWEYGLMFVTNLPEDKGMLFIFQTEELRYFWMKNTFIDLSIGYFDADKKLVSISEMSKVTSEMETNLPTYPSERPAKYALEAPKGWFQRHNIKINDKLVPP